MLKLILQLALLTGGSAFALSNVDPKLLESIQKEFGVDILGGINQLNERFIKLTAEKTVEKKGEKTAITKEGSKPATPQNDSAAVEETPKRAFIRSTSDSCPVEMIIDPATGEASCAIPAR